MQKEKHTLSIRYGQEAYASRIEDSLASRTELSDAGAMNGVRGRRGKEDRGKTVKGVISFRCHRLSSLDAFRQGLDSLQSLVFSGQTKLNSGI